MCERSDMGQFAGRVEDIADGLERDRREPDKVLCYVQSLRRLSLELDEAGLPPDLLRTLKDPSIIVGQDGAVFEAIAKWQNAPSNTASADLPGGEA